MGFVYPSTGGRNAWRSLVVQSYNTNIGHAVNYMTMPADAAGITDRLMAEVHFYGPWDFAGDAASSKYLWGLAQLVFENLPETWEVRRLRVYCC